MGGVIPGDGRRPECLSRRSPPGGRSSACGSPGDSRRCAHAGSSAVDALLQAGASAKHVSPYGDTILMAASLSGFFDQDLARLGVNINAQNRDGVSALMLLADRNRPDEIKAALKAGANAKLVDRSGHSAEAYLNATNCRRSLVRGFQPFMVITGPCPAGENEEFRKSRKMLRSAGNPRR